MNRSCLVLALAAVISVAGFSAHAQEEKQEKPEHTKDSLDTVKKSVAAGKAIVLDVREQKEWDEGHLAIAILMPSSKLKSDKDLAELVKTLDKDKIIYTHCRAGGRAATCAQILKKQGFDVRALKPGYADLIKAGFEKAKE